MCSITEPCGGRLKIEYFRPEYAVVSCLLNGHHYQLGRRPALPDPRGPLKLRCGVRGCTTIPADGKPRCSRHRETPRDAKR